jgi:hypothetical protein
MPGSTGPFRITSIQCFKWKLSTRKSLPASDSIHTGAGIVKTVLISPSLGESSSVRLGDSGYIIATAIRCSSCVVFGSSGSRPSFALSASRRRDTVD